MSSANFAGHMNGSRRTPDYRVLRRSEYHSSRVGTVAVIGATIPPVPRFSKPAQPPLTLPAICSFSLYRASNQRTHHPGRFGAGNNAIDFDLGMVVVARKFTLSRTAGPSMRETA